VFSKNTVTQATYCIQVIWATSEKNWTNTERRIDYFYNKFCSAFVLSKQDIYDFISLYKSLSVVDYMKLKQYFTLTDEIISVEV